MVNINKQGVFTSELFCENENESLKIQKTVNRNELQASSFDNAENMQKYWISYYDDSAYIDTELKALIFTSGDNIKTRGNYIDNIGFETYTISFVLHKTSDIDGYFSLNISEYGGKTIINEEIILSDTFNKYQYTFNLKSAMESIFIMASYVYLTDLKIEKGNQSTPWTPYQSFFSKECIPCISVNNFYEI